MPAQRQATKTRLRGLGGCKPLEDRVDLGGPAAFAAGVGTLREEREQEYDHLHCLLVAQL